MRCGWGTIEKRDAAQVGCSRELGGGEKMDELFVGTPSLLVAKMLLDKASTSAGQLGMMMLDIRCAFLHGFVCSRVYV